MRLKGEMLIKNNTQIPNAVRENDSITAQSKRGKERFRFFDKSRGADEEDLSFGVIKPEEVGREPVRNGGVGSQEVSDRVGKRRGG